MNNNIKNRPVKTGRYSSVHLQMDDCQEGKVKELKYYGDNFFNGENAENTEIQSPLQKYLQNMRQTTRVHKGFWSL